MLSYKLSNINNIAVSVVFLLKHFKVNHTSSHLISSLEKHPEYPSLLSLKDILSDYGIQSAGIRKGEYSYEDFETPFVCPFQREESGEINFAIITDVNGSSLTFFDPISKKKISSSISDFEKLDKGVVLLVDGSEIKDEQDYRNNRQKEKAKKILNSLPILLGGISFLGSIGYILVNNPLTVAWLNILFLITSVSGLTISVLLLLHDIDRDNPFIKEVCGGYGKKTNCEAVLSSPGAKFLNISWSVWGFAYFASFYIIQILFIGLFDYINVWAVISLVVSPYIFYSLYYQWKVIHHWCPLCLGIQGVLFVNAIASLLYFNAENRLVLDSHILFATLLIGFALLLIADYSFSLIKTARESNEYKRKWQRLRYNPEIFQALLEKSNSINIPSQHLGILIGNPEANNEIIKVCNPFCPPCSKAHPELEHIIRNNADVRLRIIFISDEGDGTKGPVSHLLAINQCLGKTVLHSALEEWYSAESKDYESFAIKYPTNSELSHQTEHIKSMNDWCDRMKIRATPTIFINGKELPEGYQVGELKNFF